jgi:HAE1 family hydrophobic/amphiphilic exporter-1
VIVAACGVGIFGLAKITPTSFLPEEDQGAFFVSVQLPDGASLARTSEAVKSVEKIVGDMPQVRDVFTVLGYSLLDSASESNAAFVFAKLKPFEDRRAVADSAQALIAKVATEGAQIRTAMVQPFNLPPIIGLSTSGGFEYQLEALEGQSPTALGSTVQGLVAAANADTRMTRVFSTYTTTNPSLYLNIDRE